MNAQAELTKQIALLEARISLLETQAVVNVVGETDTERKITSLKEFMILKKPSKDVQKTLVIAYYFEKFENLAPFSVQDIESGFKRAKEPTPTNINDKINMNIKKGHITEVKGNKSGAKAWQVTNKGDRFVESGFTNK